MMALSHTTTFKGSHNMQRIKRIITITAITAMTAGSVPAIAAAAKSTGSGSGSKGASKQQFCDAAPGIVNTLGSIAGAMDVGSAAFTVVHGAQQALFDAAEPYCSAA
jgi:hypothetical protein